MQKDVEQLSLYKYIKINSKEKGELLTKNIRDLIYNLGLMQPCITVGTFCLEFGLEVDFEKIINFIKNPKNSYELSIFGHKPPKYMRFSYKTRASRTINRHPKY